MGVESIFMVFLVMLKSSVSGGGIWVLCWVSCLWFMVMWLIGGRVMLSLVIVVLRLFFLCVCVSMCCVVVLVVVVFFLSISVVVMFGVIFLSGVGVEGWIVVML